MGGAIFDVEDPDFTKGMGALGKAGNTKPLCDSSQELFDVSDPWLAMLSVEGPGQTYGFDG
ncbi:uncharacterized protein LAESUDRAFT_728149 [Laetiporus sulphureus 93-53]|uniref:Uncharacterized protein n=1 Tax=Laetiporus sulphureus 93-53 TaxID=1314785 RepID=A0A165D8F1_9APHY|nr:uncharacterized protein LAESUDRAFT_728149 [Laetiporus sulphureus 93-53]KZT04326.1 hypothetical protein LAESUDRAFT_728149 [Laetiporus sulphureus 93-53]